MHIWKYTSLRPSWFEQRIGEDDLAFVFESCGLELVEWTGNTMTTHVSYRSSCLPQCDKRSFTHFISRKVGR